LSLVHIDIVFVDAVLNLFQQQVQLGTDDRVLVVGEADTLDTRDASFEVVDELTHLDVLLAN
jgi:hypothetical protein